MHKYIIFMSSCPFVLIFLGFAVPPHPCRVISVSRVRAHASQILINHLFFLSRFIITCYDFSIIIAATNFACI